MKFLLIILSISILTFFGFYVSKPENMPQIPDKLNISCRRDSRRGVCITYFHQQPQIKSFSKYRFNYREHFKYGK